MADDRIVIEIDANAADAQRGLRETSAGIRRLGNETQRASRQAAAFTAAGAKQRQTLGQIGNVASNAARNLSLVTAAGAAYAAREGLRYNAALESNRIALEQLTGSASKANDLLRDLEKTAKRTPFEFRDITGAARKFLAFGFSIGETKKALDATGDAVAALGGSPELIDRIVTSLGQIQAKGKVQGDEILQLAEAGINARKILQRELGLSADELSSRMQRGLLDAKTALPALIEGMNRQFDGAQERQARSFDGQISTLKDSTRQLLGAMTEGLFREMTEWLPAVNRTAEKISEVWKRDDLSPAQAFRRSRGIVSKELGPLFDEIEAAVKQADLPGMFGDAVSAATPKIAEAAGRGALLAAKTFGEAFIKADPIGKAVLGGYLAKKMGAFDLVGQMMKGKGGKGGMLGGLASKGGSPANPLWVAVVNGGAPGGVPGGGGKGGKIPPVPPWVKGAGKVALPAAGIGAFITAMSIGSEGRRRDHLGVTVLEQIEKRAPSAKQKLKEVREEIRRTEAELYKKTNRGTQDPQTVTGAGSLVLRLKNLRAHAAEFEQQANREAAAAAKIEASIARLDSSAGRDLKSLSAHARRNAKAIRDDLGVNTKQGAQAAADNMAAFARAVRGSTRAGTRAADEGTREIARLMREQLAAFGIKSTKEQNRYLSGADTKTGKPNSGAAGGVMGAARGGFFLGQPGAKGRDEIPMMVNGQPVIAAEGEYVGIFNRHQQQELNALAQRGGYRGLQDVMQSNSRPHYMAGGGIIGLGRKLQSEGYQVGEHPAFGGVGRHAPNSYHYRGQAIDVNADGQGQAFENKRLDSLAARLRGMPGVAELLWRVAGHFDHLHVAMTGAGGTLGAGGGGTKAERLKRVMWDGPGGALGKLGQAGLDRVLAGAQSRLDGVAGTFGADIGEDPFTGGGGVSSAGGRFDRAALEKLWTSAGGSPGLARLMAAIALAESSGNPSVTNSIGARGLWQIIPSTARAFGFDHRLLTDPMLNARAAVAIQKGQGLGAWEAYTRGMHAKFMARGGIMRAAGGLVSDKSRKAKDDRKAHKQIKQSTKRSKSKAKRRATGLTNRFPDTYLDRIESLTGEGGKVGVWERLLGQMQREHARTDEDAQIAGLDEQNPDGSYKIPQDVADRRFREIVQAHLGELGQELTLADSMVAAYDAPDGVTATYAKAVDRIRDGIQERKTRERELVASAQANREEIKQTQKAYFAEKKKKKPSKAELSRLAGRLDKLRDDRFRLIGTRETTGSLNDVDAGLLGSTRRGLATFRDTLPGVERGMLAAPLDAADKRADRQDILDEIRAWGGRAMAARETPAVPDAPAADDGQADALRQQREELLRQQRDEALRDLAVQGKQFGVFGGMQSLVGGRLVGAFSHGIDRVPETGLAYVHKDERILPQDYGPYGMDQRGAGGSPVSVQLTFGDNSGQLVRLVDARVNGAVARVSQDMGRRQRMITVAPGGR